MILTCKQCNIEFNRPTNQVKKEQKNYFCSSSCDKEFKKRKICIKYCKFCNKEMRIAEIIIKRGGGIFCNRSCSAKFNNPLNPKRKVEGNCTICNTPIPSKLKYCKNHKPEVKAIKDLKSNGQIRLRLFAERGRKCEICGWDKVNPFTGHIPVQVDHIDGNRKNNASNNLQVICPSCHSLTQHFMFYGKSHKNNYGSKGTKRYRNSGGSYKR